MGAFQQTPYPNFLNESYDILIKNSQNFISYGSVSNK